MAKEKMITTDPEILKMAKKHKRPGPGQYVLFFFLILYTLFCFLPFLLVVISAFSDESSILNKGFSYFPDAWSMTAMNSVFKYGKQLLVSYGVTIFITVVGTFTGLILQSMYAYALTRPDFRLKKLLSIWIIIPMLFQGGMLSAYLIFTGWYKLKDSLFLLTVPPAIGTMNIIIMRTYIANSIPNELNEAAKIDGAGDYRTFFQITLPLMKPSLAAVGFMMATGFWNEWQNALIYIDSKNKKPLQLLLVNIQKNIEMLMNSKDIPPEVMAIMGNKLPGNTITMATVLVVVGPILVVYPFFQKYFIKGLTVGSVKG